MKLVIHLYNLKFHPLNKSFLFLQFEIIILSMEKSVFYHNLEYQVWNFCFAYREIIFITTTWNVKFEITILPLEKSFSYCNFKCQV